MKKKNKYTQEQIEIHEKAVKLRKMTDEQLINYIEKQKEDAYSIGYRAGRNKN